MGSRGGTRELALEKDPVGQVRKRASLWRWEIKGFVGSPWPRPVDPSKGQRVHTRPEVRVKLLRLV